MGGMRCQRILSVFGLLLALCVGPAPTFTSTQRSKAASISLRAKWPSPPSLLEAAAFLAERGDNSLWQFIDQWHSSQNDITQGCWSRIITTAGEFLSPSMTKVLQVMLSIRLYSPLLELWRTQAIAAGADKDSCAFVVVNGQRTDSFEKLELILDGEGWGEPQVHEDIYDFDIEYPADSTKKMGPAITAVLYGAIGSQSFWDFHQILALKAKAAANKGQPHLQYIYRPVLLEGCSATRQQTDPCIQLGTGENLPVPGFGVEMAVKNMEYSAMDDQQAAKARSDASEDSSLDEVNHFDFKTLIRRKPELKQELLGFRDHLLASQSAEENLKVWDLKDLGIQASQRIAQSSDPLQSLADISQNFPNLAAVLSRSKIELDHRAELKHNQRILPGGASFMLMNGMFLDPETNIYEIFGQIRKEVTLAEQLQGNKVQLQVVSALMALRGKAMNADQDQTLRIDLSQSGQIVYLNDLEKDRLYRRWDTSVMDLMRVYPGVLPRIRLNLFTCVYLVDPGTIEGLRLAQHAAELLLAGQWPLRIGQMVVSAQTLQRVGTGGEVAISLDSWEDLSLGEKVTGLYHILQQFVETKAAAIFLAAIKDPSIQASGSKTGEISWKYVQTAYDETLAEYEDLAKELYDINKAHTLVEGGITTLLTRQATALSATGISSLINSMWLNGMVMPSRGQLASYQARIGYGLQTEMQRLQEMVYYGKLTDRETDIPAFLMSHFKALPRYNPRITATEGDDAGVQLPLIQKLTPLASDQLNYLHQPGTEDAIKAITHWIVVDLTSQDGRSLLRESLLHLSSPASSQSRVGIVLSATATPKTLNLLEKTVLATNLLPARRSRLPNFLLTLLSIWSGSGAGADLLDEPQILNIAEEAGLNSKALGNALSTDLAAMYQHHLQLSRKLMEGRPDSNAVVSNGRVIMFKADPSDDASGIVAADFVLLEHHAVSSQLAGHIAATLEAALLEGNLFQRDEKDIGRMAEEGEMFEEVTIEDASDVALVASSVLASYLDKEPYRVQGQADEVIQAMAKLHGKTTSFEVQGGRDVALSITAVLDPLSKVAQQLSNTLNFLRSTLQPAIKVYLNPQPDLSNLPLKSYYRLALPKFSSTGDTLEMPGAPSAEFTGLPSTKVLTLHMDVPEAWLVEPVRAAYDLDNLRLSDLGSESTLTAEFELEAILLTGRCLDLAARTREQATPRGVQLHLKSSREPHLVDTLVMSNLGYFQLKAGPGVYNLSLAPGRSKLLYDVVQGQDLQTLKQVTETGLSQMPVVLKSFQGKSQQLSLWKKAGYEDADVLAETAEQGSILKGMSGWLGKGSKSGNKKVAERLSPESDPDTIHIFTIASGHMYERLQKIMILSLIRNTRNRVKVWFIKNYMSPQMKLFLPHMAEHYNFDYEFVTYKWPSWLHKQTDKQRIIWAYKILFLDVLFPLNLRKVIFVDSDQIIRADFAELWNMDLKGAPLAYTPFCDNNKDMDGFRFWKQGFWQSHLQDRPYHISALYVVDLAKFRQMAAGDQLRIVYEQLSKDPNSLSNLDQDLPNYAQHQVPIFSLPQEWLWCETWCGNETKFAAKTIDLCNNPLTKEPKLQSARRIAPEWIGLDAEAQAYTAEVEERLSKQAEECGGHFEKGELSLSSGRQEEVLSQDAPSEEAEEVMSVSRADAHDEL